MIIKDPPGVSLIAPEGEYASLIFTCEDGKSVLYSITDDGFGVGEGMNLLIKWVKEVRARRPESIRIHRGNPPDAGTIDTSHIEAHESSAGAIRKEQEFEFLVDTPNLDKLAIVDLLQRKVEHAKHRRIVEEMLERLIAGGPGSSVPGWYFRRLKYGGQGAWAIDHLVLHFSHDYTEFQVGQSGVNRSVGLISAETFIEDAQKVKSPEVEANVLKDRKEGAPAFLRRIMD